ncbi:MAG: hypothetical protein JJ911_07840 [Rhizobiaceae bacterium]|nr:hypothetical protein [Rhizobiaceae bacterium]
MSPTASVDHGREVGRLRGPNGSAEDALVDLIEAAAGIADRDIDLNAGEVVIGQTVAVLEVRAHCHDGTVYAATYGKRPPCGAYAVAHYPINAIANIAQEIIHVQ